MPGPVAHGVHALAYCTQAAPNRNPLLVLRGAEFPDIRNLAGLPRNSTHLMGVQVSDVDAQLDDWQAGLLLHSYLDEQWTLAISEFGLVSGNPDHEHMWLALKIAEDILLTDTLSPQNRSLFEQALQMPAPSSETGLVSDSAMLELWNNWIRWKLLEPFDATQWLEWSRKITFDPDFLQSAMALADELRTDTQWRDRLGVIAQNFGYA